MKLLAEWFWVDRWDGSSAALLPMEAQGVYRAMLSQAWRRGAKLPRDLAQVQRAIRCTAEEWARSWPLVKQYWREDGDSLVNDTQVEVYAETIARYEKRELKAKVAARARWNAPRNAPSIKQAKPEHMLVQCPPSPDPYPSKELDQSKELKRKKNLPASPVLFPESPQPAPKAARETWITPYEAAWRARWGEECEPPRGEMLKALSVARTRLGDAESQGRWGRFLAAAETSQWARPTRFVQGLGEWSEEKRAMALAKSNGSADRNGPPGGILEQGKRVYLRMKQMQAEAQSGKS